MIMKKYVKPETKKVLLGSNLCGNEGGGANAGNGKICGVTTIFNVSGKERKSYEFCYHYPTGTNRDGSRTYSSSTAKVICVKPGEGLTILEQGSVTVDGKTHTGWGDFKGTNGLCHFTGRVSITRNGVPTEVTSTNVSSYACK